HNEEAWQLRLLLSKPVRAPQPGEQPVRQQTQQRRQQPVMPLPALRPRRLSRALLIVLPLLALPAFAVAAAPGIFPWSGWSEVLTGEGAGHGSALAAPPAQPAAPPASASAPGLLFPETKYTVSEPFLGYWASHSGLQLFGYPISPRMTVQSKGGENLE